MESDDEDMFVDNLSDVSKDSDNIEDSDRDVLSSDSERDDGVEDESDKEDVDVWTEIDHAPNLEPFLGKSQINTMPNDPSSICEVVSLFFGDDLFQFMVDETNRYRLQNRDKMRDNKNSLQWKNINIMELKHFIGLILIMGLVRKDSRDDYWSTDPTIETPVFSKVMSRSRFRQIWRTWHFCNNENMNETSERLFKISPILDYFVSKFNTVYKPQQELSLDESIIPWRRGLFSKVYNAGKLIKYGLLVTTVCEASSGYICNLEICTTKGTKLIDTILSVTSPFHNLWHHIYMDNYYNNVEMGKVLLSHKIRICGTIRANRELPISLKNVQLSRGGLLKAIIKNEKLEIIFTNLKQS
ncbi:PREDICTED: piggyBac transposable element-derived protein 4-like [Dufourea novaeangliae]|uniref:piggyBac transposable element-derived protein 4-like n=1 Tax=Dufourea novaeangliae TaxID=178035 RepID=UPI00076765EC|nr:PREDICTED: piggyBac transposable element-derived protein 4-like [Dufourea novaeangliae]